MNKNTNTALQNKSSNDRGAIVFLKFCRALGQYCDEIGVDRHRFSAAQILHSAAYNTMNAPVKNCAQMRQMATMTDRIPELFDALIKISCKEGSLNMVRRTSGMSLAEILNLIAKNSYSR
ncbi:hypothetical protein HDR61_02260 [bacterium]|nr:hypothetical protein [bacterium]